jgi:hypothetical protein
MSAAPDFKVSGQHVLITGGTGGTAVFLASPAARLINDVTIPVDGGYVAS